MIQRQRWEWLNALPQPCFHKPSPAEQLQVSSRNPYLQVKRQRGDFQHKAALTLARANNTIYHEDLQVANMVKNHRLAKSIQDAGWAAFLSILTAKAAYAGRRVVAVPPAYTSQACSGCGVIVQKGLSVRWHACPDCVTSLHRDHNAALNILRLGKNNSGAGQSPQAPT